MQVNDQLIDKIADLARLDFQGEARELIRQDLTRMLDFVDKINELDTTGVEPLIHLTQAVNRYTEDKPEAATPAEQALKNAPKRDSDYFRVPRVVDK